ncbi:DUF493 family protein [Maridesulfovibrio sp.]|uniref:DUF493 family protein n=1 Tax=Maridesulfovibrio sp. TaxID=2795000 RepID=UPI0039EE3017
MANSIQQFKVVLDEHHEWPCDYTFKFIVPCKSLDELKSMIDGFPYTEKESKTGKYSSVTVVIHANSSDVILNIYEKAATIEGLISL